MHRLFVGIRPPLPIRATLRETQGGVPGARWQEDEQLHITLRFIGEVERRQAEEIALALGTVRAPAAEIAIAGVGMFDQRGRPSALWAGITPDAPLAALHRKVDRALVQLGLEPEGRAYLPHVTIARLRANIGGTRAWLAEHAALRSAPFLVDHFLLYESRLGHGGAAYEAVARYPLG